MRHVVIAPDGTAAGFWLEEQERPDGSLQITEADWRDYLDHQGFRKLIDNGDGTASIVVYEPPSPPPPVPSWTPLEFLERFTRQERAAIRAAALQSDDLADWLDLLRASTEVRADDARAVAGLQALADAGLITAARRDEILS